MSVCAGVCARAHSSHMHTPTDASHVHVDSKDTEEAAETVLIVHIAEGNAGAVQGTAAVESKGRVRAPSRTSSSAINKRGKIARLRLAGSS